MTWHPDIPEEYRNQIVTGDARELTKRIPDESIDLIFTDPVYDRIEDYEWLAKESARILKDDSACLVWQDISMLPQTFEAMENLNYIWTLGWFKAGSMNLCHNWIYYKWTPILWFAKGKNKLLNSIQDMRSEAFCSGKNHKWQKEKGIIKYYLSAFDGLVFDPFTGSGTVPAVCKMLGRNYIAFEIDPDTAELARERARNTQPPLFVLEPEQQEMNL